MEAPPPPGRCTTFLPAVLADHRQPATDNCLWRSYVRSHLHLSQARRNHLQFPGFTRQAPLLLPSRSRFPTAQSGLGSRHHHRARRQSPRTGLVPALLRLQVKPMKSQSYLQLFWMEYFAGNRARISSVFKTLHLQRGRGWQVAGTDREHS